MSATATVSSRPIPPSPNQPANLEDFQPSLAALSSRPSSSASINRDSSNTNRPPTLHFPSLHLGSFDTLTASPQPFSTSPLSPTTNSSHSNSANSPLPRDFHLGIQEREGDGSGQGGLKRTDVAGGAIRDDLHGSSDIDGSRLSVQPSRSSSHHSSRSSHRLHRDKSQIPPPLPPPTMALPPLPILSPISPIGPSSPIGSGSGKGIPSTLFQPSSNSSSSSSLAQQLPSPNGSRQLPTVPIRGRPLGHSLTISIPRPLTPSSERDSNPLHSPILKNSPGVARRRTVIENNGTYHASPVKVSGVVGTFTPPRDTSPTPEKRSPPIELGSVMMPQPTPTPKIEQKASMESPTRRLEKKRSSIDLKNSSTSPSTSPSARRSLPRPPRIDPSLTARSSGPELSQPVSTSRLQTAAPTDVATAPHTKQQSAPVPESSQVSQNQPSLIPPHTAPVPSSSWPPLNVAKSPQIRTQALPADLPAKPTFYQKHQANKSASSLPVVAGLADAGPYSGAAFSKPAVPNGVGIGRPAGQPTAGPSRPTLKPQEEVCLECMMRDRDLADVIVSGEGIWERTSDADWRDLEWREQALLKSMGNLDDNTSITGILGRAADESSEDSDSTSVSRPSIGNSREDVQLRRAIEEKNRRRSLIRAKKREADWRIVNEVGWKGFKWEEGEAGEGLPRGFRGSKGGKLTEPGIKAVMSKFPSASAHRYQTLQTYLRQQWMLVLEVRAEAQRLGMFPFPDDVITSSSTVSSHEGQGTSYARSTAASAMDQYGGAFTPVRQTPALSIVRPSPSSPANLTGLASAPPRVAPLQRPLTHFLPDREPSLSAPRTPQYGSPASATSRVRHGKQGSSPGVLERSPQRSGTYEESNEELWSPDEATGGNLRPFSFAVRAGAAAARDGAGSDGHGRRSLWGRFGGSVTSLFGGSQNGSGSMMDMHLGLDNERRNRSSSFNVNSHPRAVSLASPTRPSFFSRDSRCSSVVDVDQTREPRVSRVISHSRLSQMRLDDDEPDEEEPQTKKKGIKGFFKKMKPKGARSKKSESAFRVEDEPRRESETPLAPPPSMSYLAGNRKHNRNRSGSSSSMLTDGQDSNQSRRHSASLPYGMRSVSAPMNGAASSSGGSLSASPTSSKFATSGPKRESYASARRQSVTLNDMGEESDKRGSVMEMLSNGGGAGNGGTRGVYTSPEAQMIYDEPTSMYRSNNPGYPNQQFRPHNKTTSSFSVSSGTMAIETPPPAVYNSNTFFNHQMQSHQTSNGVSHQQHQQQAQMQKQSHANTPTITKSPSAQFSPNRFKNLPPLPLGQDPVEPGMTASPDSFAAAFPDQEINLNLNGTVHDPKYLANQGGYQHQQGPPPQQKIIDFTTANGGAPPPAGRYQPGGILQTGRGQPQAYGYPQPSPHHTQSQAAQGYPSAHARALATGRASFDQLTPRGRVGQDARAVKTMYGQPLVSDLGPVGGYDSATGMGYGTEKQKKKGFKGFFGGSKAGRMA
ncbi:hypothetical protein I316_05582 [Kwoniella heveanensis BCC8398]|uniref:Uncharacterized protein n=1 Tax=Kwoniella heveanensis BCC8398 TaxID=1296120 RepID=A0A1B9GNT0_9TREE|nr:hypothetical protein I316_05582 [Kwoniella heveanensis BCC8398]